MIWRPCTRAKNVTKLRTVVTGWDILGGGYFWCASQNLDGTVDRAQEKKCSTGPKAGIQPKKFFQENYKSCPAGWIFMEINWVKNKY